MCHHFDLQPVPGYRMGATSTLVPIVTGPLSAGR